MAPNTEFSSKAAEKQQPGDWLHFSDKVHQHVPEAEQEPVAEGGEEVAPELLSPKARSSSSSSTSSTSSSGSSGAPTSKAASGNHHHHAVHPNQFHSKRRVLHSAKKPSPSSSAATATASSSSSQQRSLHLPTIAVHPAPSGEARRHQGGAPTVEAGRLNPLRCQAKLNMQKEQLRQEEQHRLDKMLRAQAFRVQGEFEVLTRLYSPMEQSRRRLAERLAAST